MIKPSVGRIVLYRQGTAGVFPGSDDVVPAIVTRVHSDRLVNVAVFDANGVPVPGGRTSITLVQPGDPAPSHAHCHWMDFQVAQAARPAA